jgi:predicted ATPase
VGPKGENAYQLLCSDDALVTQVSAWFENNFAGCKLRVVSAGSEKGTYLIQMNKPDNGSYWVNIADEGMGMSQILPIVIRCIHPVKDSIVVVEQPELHLHPAAHEGIAKLFATTSKQNNQRYIVETHSENVILGLREAVVDETVDFCADDVVIYFVDEDDEGASLRKITIDANGMLSSWPEGVFNESYDLLQKIITKSPHNHDIQY